MRRLRALTIAALAVISTVAVAGSDSVKIKKVGNVAVKWNAVRYRLDLMAQLKPGLTWRLGKGDATRLTLSKLALVSANTILLPGEMTLNLRYWSNAKWELVVFEENDWKWTEESTEFAVIPARVGQETAEKKFAKELTLDLRANTRGNRTEAPRSARTGEDGGLTDIWDVPDDVAYPPDQQKVWNDLPSVELEMRFGPHMALVDFEPVKAETLTDKRTTTDGTTAPLELVYVQLPAPRVRQTFLAEHEGAIPFGVVTKGAPDGKPVLLSLSGGEDPMLWVYSRNGQEDIGEFEGSAAVGERTKSADTVRARLDGNVLTVEVAEMDYTFTLWE